MNKHDTPVAKRLRYFMRQVEITQSALARLSKVSQPTIARILSGKTPDPDVTTLMKLGRALGNEGFIKRLQRIPGEGLRVLSANRDFYEPWTVKPDMDFEVIGRVLKIWRGDDF